MLPFLLRVFETVYLLPQKYRTTIECIKTKQTNNQFNTQTIHHIVSKLTSPPSAIMLCCSVMRMVDSPFHLLHRVAHNWPTQQQQQQHQHRQHQQQQQQTISQSNTIAHHLTQIQQAHRSHRKNHSINHQQQVRHTYPMTLKIASIYP